jgi:hypothetical protein
MRTVYRQPVPQSLPAAAGESTQLEVAHNARAAAIVVLSCLRGRNKKTGVIGPLAAFLL